jgi:L-alanine-DL-glutamate epimerase-like enolase superfamily enzyme
LNPKVTGTKPPIYPAEFTDEIDNVDENGCVAVPQGPGLGVDPDWDYIKSHEVNRVERS